MVDVSGPASVTPPSRSRPAKPARPAALKIATAGSALAGAMALLLVRGPARPELFFLAGGAVVLATVVYLVRPRAGAVALVVTGIVVCSICVGALLSLGTLPWLLTGFWGGSATLLAGLLDLIGKDTNDAMIGVTVVAVVSLLLLSALGLGAYVRLTWTAAARAMLEAVPTDATDPAASRLGSSGAAVEPAADGRWACRWAVRTRDVSRTWRTLEIAIQAAGWEITRSEPSEQLIAEKDGYELSIEVQKLADAAEAGAEPLTVTPIQFVASVGVE